MKVKKLILLLPLLLVLLLSSAGCSSKNKYKLTVNDPEGILIEKLDKSYSAGTKVTVKTEIMDCGGIWAYLDGESLGNHTTVEENGQSHWEFYFVMPEHDAVLTFDVLGGDPIEVPDGYYQLTVADTDAVLSEQLEERYPAGERVTVKTRVQEQGTVKALLDGASLGERTVVENDGQSHWEFYFIMPEHDAVLSLEVSRSDTPAPSEAYDGSFYSLSHAYELGELTLDDLKSIAYYKNGGNSENEEIIPDGFVPAEKTPLSEETELSIKYSYLDDIKKYEILMLEEYKADGVTVDYYGTYGNCVVVILHGYVEYAQATGVETVGGINFLYGDGNRLAVWVRQDDGEAIEENIGFDMGVTYDGDLVLSSFYDLRVESLFLNYEHFARFTRDKSCFPDGPNGEENTALSAMKEKYTEEYFEQNALIVVKFFSPTWGGAFKNVFLTRKGNKLFLNYEYAYGDSDAICYPALVLEVSKTDLQDADILRVNFKR